LTQTADEIGKQIAFLGSHHIVLLKGESLTAGIWGGPGHPAITTFRPAKPRDIARLKAIA